MVANFSLNSSFDKYLIYGETNLNKPHYDVIIITPGHSMHSEYVKSLTDTIKALTERGISWKWNTGYSSLVHRAREVAMSGNGTMDPDARGPLNDNCTYNKIFWIDSDIRWKPEDFMRLYDSPEQVISGAYLLANGKTSTVYTKQYPSGVPKSDIKQFKTVTAVQHVGFGFICVKSGVFEKMQRPWFGLLTQTFMNSRNEPIYDCMGEDVSWCIKVTSLNIPIMFDPRVLVTHMKTITIDW